MSERVWAVWRLDDGAVEVAWRVGLRRTSYRFEPDGSVEIRTADSGAPLVYDPPAEER